MTWLFNESPFTEVPKGFAGFVYLITNKETGRKYLGRKYFTTKRKPKKGARRVTKESDWRNYWSSSIPLQEEVFNNEDNYIREILVLYKTRGDVNYMETKLLWKYNVLEDDMYYKPKSLILHLFRQEMNLQKLLNC